MGNKNQTLYSSKIIKAGALLADTKTLLAQWDETQSAAENLKRAREENIFGKASRSRVEDILVIFRQRYLSDELVTSALISLLQAGFSNEVLDRILYFHAARSDALLHDTVTDLLGTRISLGRQDIDTIDVQNWIRIQIENGKTRGPWSGNTISRAAREILSTLRDFGILVGATKKKLAPAFLPTESFAYIAFYLNQNQPSGRLLLEEPEWQLFFLDHSAIERFFVEAQQHRLLNYSAAGSIVRITFPANTVDEYAHVIAERTYRST